MSSPQRLATIASLGLRGHAGDLHLDAAVQTLATACRVPIAALDMVTPGLQTYPAEVGLGRPCTTVPDELNPCAEVVDTGRPLQVPDATTHPRYADNPLVQEGAFRAYAGHPVTHQGQTVGVLSVFDAGPRDFLDTELGMLARVALLVEALLALRAAATWDPLTGLGSRPLLLDRLTGAMTRAAAGGRLAGLAVLDVQGMSELNLRHGSVAGDAVLTAVAARLRAAVRHGDSVARLGGDEFAIVLEDLASIEEGRARTAELLSCATAPVVHGDQVLPVELGWGLATTPASDADALVAAAENAASRTAGHVAGQAPPGTTLAARAAELRRALADDELVLHYQPVLDLRTGQVHGVEALLRWEHPERGLVPPSDFIPDAEQTGLIVPIGTAVLRAAAQQAAAWARAGRPLSVAINLSPRQMGEPEFAQTVADVLSSTGAPPELIVLEITESSVLDQPSAPQTLAALRTLGVHLALDDFGTGYSSLTYLRRFPVDSVKIDRSFVAGIGRSADDDAIVASVVSLATAVGKSVVAEGVEHEAQADALRQLGVPLAQGFLWSRPRPVAALEQWLQDRPLPVAPAPAVPAPRAAVEPPAPGSAGQTILELHRDGASLHTIAAALNAAGSRTDRGVRWHTRSVAAVVASLAPTS